MIKLGNIEEKKTLSGEAWIELGKELRFRIDYPTRGQETQLRVLRLRWEDGKNSENDPHWIGYYIQMTVKDVEGFVDKETGIPFKLEVREGMATELVAGKKRLNFLAVLTEYALIVPLFGLIHERLSVTELSKKKSSLPPSSSKRESSRKARNNSSPAKSQTDGNHSEKTVAGTLSSVTA